MRHCGRRSAFTAQHHTAFSPLPSNRLCLALLPTLIDKRHYHTQHLTTSTAHRRYAPRTTSLLPAHLLPALLPPPHHYPLPLLTPYAGDMGSRADGHRALMNVVMTMDDAFAFALWNLVHRITGDMEGGLLPSSALRYAHKALPTPRYACSLPQARSSCRRHAFSATPRPFQCLSALAPPHGIP